VRGTLVDSNVLFDILSDDAEWTDWSAAMLTAAANRGPIIINPIVYAEVSVRYERIEDIDAALPEEYFVRQALPWEAGFLAAKCFVAYRRRGGTRTAPLPDFYIGAHAAVAGLTLLTRDPKRYLAYLPKLPLICP